jgi:mannose-6-phosphate isomerase-like protein (cupin superfamily)
VERASRTDERAGQLHVGARVDEEPRVLVAEAEESELFEAPADDALLLERSLEGLRWVLRRRHTSFNDEMRPELLAERKASLRTRCAHLAAARVRVATASQGGEMAEYTMKRLEEVRDVLGDYPGEMRMMTGDLEAEQVAFTYRRMPQHTGGRGSYGHRHKEQEEVYFVASGKLLFKLGDDVVEVERGTAVRVPPETWRSVWNDEPEDAELIIVSKVVPGGSRDDAEYLENFWPE